MHKNDVYTGEFSMSVSSGSYVYGDGPVRVSQYAILPESIEIRSFARPHVYCMFKVGTSSFGLFNDFGYGFEEGKNKVLDLGQVSEGNGGKFDLFKFNLEDMKPYLLHRVNCKSKCTLWKIEEVRSAFSLTSINSGFLGTSFLCI